MIYPLNGALLDWGPPLRCSFSARLRLACFSSLRNWSAAAANHSGSSAASAVSAGFAAAVGGGGGRCGCFLPGGLVRGMGGEACGETRVWEVASQPVAHWGPPCHHVVDGQPHWNRRLWAGPERRHSSVVAACATRARSRLSHTFTRVYFRCHRVLPLVWRGRCLLFPHPAHPPCHVHFENRVASLFFTPPKSANCAEQLDPPSVAPRPEPRALALA